jgi:hypothetical protein
MEPALSTVNQFPVVACRLERGLMDSPKSTSEVAPLPAF